MQAKLACHMRTISIVSRQPSYSAHAYAAASDDFFYLDALVTFHATLTVLLPGTNFLERIIEIWQNDVTNTSLTPQETASPLSAQICSLHKFRSLLRLMGLGFAPIRERGGVFMASVSLVAA